jgi:hypothetical protein
MMRFLLFISCCIVAFGQDQVERMLRFQNVSTNNARQEVGTIVRSTAEPLQAQFNLEAGTITIRGSQTLVDAGEWIFRQLDQPTTASSIAPAQHHIEGTNESIRIIRLPHTQSVPEFQECATLVRSIFRIRRLFAYNDGRAMVLRAPDSDAAKAEWMALELERASKYPVGERPPKEYLGTSSREDMIRLRFLEHSPSVAEFQEAVTAARTVAAIPQVFTYNSLRAVAFRGSSTQIALTDWLLQELDQQTESQVTASRTFTTGATTPDEEASRVFYVRKATSVADFQQTVKRIRELTGVKRAATYNRSRAMLLIGTNAQLAQAEREIQ